MKHKIRYIGKILDTKAYLMVRNDVLYILYNGGKISFKIIFFDDFKGNLYDIQYYLIKYDVLKPIEELDFDIFYHILNKQELIRKANLLYIEQYV